MIRIEPFLLWLGHAGDCRDRERILEAGIDAVVQLAIEEPPVVLPREIVFVRIPLYDGSGNSPDVLRLAVKTVEHLLAAKVPTLLCCSGGMSRSPAIAAFAIARSSGQSPAQSLEHVRGWHGTDVSPALWQDLLACVSD
ncbi:MAG: dual specificity protein phosphatase [Pirellulales bacterium]